MLLSGRCRVGVGVTGIRKVHRIRSRALWSTGNDWRSLCSLEPSLGVTMYADQPTRKLVRWSVGVGETALRCFLHTVDVPVVVQKLIDWRAGEGETTRTSDSFGVVLCTAVCGGRRRGGRRGCW